MRYELTDHEWTAIEPMLPKKPRGVAPVIDASSTASLGVAVRGVLAGPPRKLRSIHLLQSLRSLAGVWGKIMNALAGAHDAAVQMVDTSIVHVHQHAACITRNRRQSMGRSRGGLTSKIHAVVNANRLPVRLALTAADTHDNRLAGNLLSRLKARSMLLADRGYDADWIGALVARRRAWVNIPPRSNRNEPICFSRTRGHNPPAAGKDLHSIRPVRYSAD